MSKPERPCWGQLFQGLGELCSGVAESTYLRELRSQMYEQTFFLDSPGMSLRLVSILTASRRSTRSDMPSPWKTPCSFPAEQR